MPVFSCRRSASLLAFSLVFCALASFAQNPPTSSPPVSPVESKATSKASKKKAKVVANATAAGNKAAAATATEPPAPLTPGDAINAALDDQQVQGDYIPCKFSLSQLRGLVLPDVAPTLSSAQSEQLKQKIISAALAQNTLPLNQDSSLANFVKLIKEKDFT